MMIYTIKDLSKELKIDKQKIYRYIKKEKIDERFLDMKMIRIKKLIQTINYEVKENDDSKIIIDMNDFEVEVLR